MKKTFLFLFFLSVSFLQINAQSNWPMVNGGADLSSFAKNENELKPPFNSERTIAIPGVEFAYSDNLLVVGQTGSPNRVVAVNWETGAELWSFEIPNTSGAIGCVPAITDNLVLCGGQSGLGLYALNKSTGEQVWHQPIGELYTRNPVVSDGKVYVVQDKLYCFNLSDGSEVWTYPFSGQFTPAVDDKNVYLPGSGGAAIDKLTGQKKFDIISSDRNLVIDEQNIYISKGANITALSKTDGSVVWEVPRLGGDLPFLNGGAFAVSDQYLCYIVWANGDNKGVIYTLKKSDGSNVWNYAFEDQGAFTPRIANGVVYALNWKPGGLWGFNLSDGSVLFHDSESGFADPPIIADHSLVVNNDSELKILSSNVTAVDDENDLSIPEMFILENNFPNPFSKSSSGNAVTTIKYSISESTLETQNVASPQLVVLKVFNILGREIATLVDKKQAPGNYSVRFNAENLPSGIYLYKLSTGGFSQTKKMVILN